jgi:hypothetical protein
MMEHFVHVYRPAPGIMSCYGTRRITEAEELLEIIACAPAKLQAFYFPHHTRNNSLNAVLCTEEAVF